MWFLEDGPVPTLGWGDRMWVLFNVKVVSGPTVNGYYVLWLVYWCY